MRKTWKMSRYVWDAAQVIGQNDTQFRERI
jgi:hypothetical protein